MICYQLDLITNEERSLVSSVGSFSVIVPGNAELNDQVHTPKDSEATLNVDASFELFFHGINHGAYYSKKK